jgi:hypothetical protein
MPATVKPEELIRIALLRACCPDNVTYKCVTRRSNFGVATENDLKAGLSGTRAGFRTISRAEKIILGSHFVTSTLAAAGVAPGFRTGPKSSYLLFARNIQKSSPRPAETLFVRTRHPPLDPARPAACPVKNWRQTMAETFPAGDWPYLGWVSNLSARLTATGPAYGVPTAEATILANLVTDLTARMETLENPANQNPVNRAAKNLSKKACVAKTRAVLKLVNAYAPLTAVQREELGLRPKDTTRSARPAPTTRPVIQVARDGSFRVADELTPDKKTKPANAQGCQIVIKIDGPAPLTPAEAHPGVLATRSTGQLPIPPGSNGRVLHVMGQWYTETGDFGPASDVVSVVIAA